MDYEIFTYVFSVLSMLCLLNSFDYWDDYRHYYIQFAKPEQARYAKALLRDAVLCFVWGIIWALVAAGFWFIPHL